MVNRAATPLHRKLGLRPGDSVCILDAPSGYAPELPLDVVLVELGDGPHDIIQVFFRERATLQASLGALRAQMKPACGLWVCWPKRASRMQTDMSEAVVREVALPTGLVDNKVCAIDATWSGLRLVIRRELR